MEKLETFTEVLLSLKDKEVLTTNKKDRYILKKDKIYVYREGTSFVLSLEDFRDLYQEKTFFVFKEEGPYIDSDKDEAYYRYYRK